MPLPPDPDSGHDQDLAASLRQCGYLCAIIALAIFMGSRDSNRTAS